MNRTLRGVLLFALFAITVSGCGDDDDDGAGGDGELVTIDFLQPLPKSIAFYPLFVAEQLGYFEEEGIEVNLLPSGDVPATVAVVSGNATIGATTSANIVSAANQDENFRLIYEYYQKNVFSVVVPDGSDVEDVADLDGANVGITSEAAGDSAIARAAVTEAGLDPDAEVTFTVVGEGGPIVANALESGQIDAYAGAINDLVALRVEGIEYRDITPDNLQSMPASSMIMAPEDIEELEEPIGGFLRAWAKATYVGFVNEDVVYAMAEEEVPEETADEEFGRAFLEVALDLQTPLLGDDEFGALRLDAWEVVQEQLIAGGELEGEFDFSPFLDDRFIEIANDWDRAEVEQEAEAWADENA
ncbi:MAG: ABC transporter substrate-binding protein [Acidimicrobiales bacterium]